MSALDAEYPLGYYNAPAHRLGRPQKCRWCGKPLITVGQAVVCPQCDRADLVEKGR